MTDPAGSAPVLAPLPARDMLSIVFSFRNEEEVLPELIRRTGAVLETLALDYEMIFVNDASTDRSLAILRDHHARDPRIKVVNMARRFGVSECVLAGMEAAGGDALVYMDADLQDPPEVIPDLVAKWRDGADVVYTVRTVRAGESPLKMWITRQAYRLINAMSDVDLPTNSGDFRLISRRVRDLLMELKETDPYLRGLVRWVGLRQEPVYYEREARAAGVAHFPLIGSINPTKTFIVGFTSFTVGPIYLMLTGGLAATGLALFALAGFAIAALAGAPSSWGALIAFLVFLWGSLMAALGMVGVYVTRTYKDVRGRPRYVIDDTLGFS